MTRGGVGNDRRSVPAPLQSRSRCVASPLLRPREASASFCFAPAGSAPAGEQVGHRRPPHGRRRTPGGPEPQAPGVDHRMTPHGTLCRRTEVIYRDAVEGGYLPRSSPRVRSRSRAHTSRPPTDRAQPPGASPSGSASPASEPRSPRERSPLRSASVPPPLYVDLTIRHPVLGRAASRPRAWRRRSGSRRRTPLRHTCAVMMPSQVRSSARPLDRTGTRPPPETEPGMGPSPDAPVTKRAAGYKTSSLLIFVSTCRLLADVDARSPGVSPRDPAPTTSRGQHRRAPHGGAVVNHTDRLCCRGAA